MSIVRRPASPTNDQTPFALSWYGAESWPVDASVALWSASAITE